MNSVLVNFLRWASSQPVARTLLGPAFRTGSAAISAARHSRLVRLSENQLDQSVIDRCRVDSRFNNILDDLQAFTGLSEDELHKRILRHPATHFESEFSWANPQSRRELTWFYQTNTGYIFANSVHPCDDRISKFLNGGRILDFGAGAGSNTIELAKLCKQVDFIEIGSIQADFILFRATRRGLTNVSQIPVFAGDVFDPIQNLTGPYDTVMAIDVLEHIPDYHLTLRRLIDNITPGGIFIESSPFDNNAPDIAIHVKAPVPLATAMVGMENIGPGVWRKAI